MLAPRATATRFGVRLTALAFSQVKVELLCCMQGGHSCSQLIPALLPRAPTLQTAPAVVVGADDGAVSVYSLAGLYDADAAAAGGDAWREQRRRLEAALLQHATQRTGE